ncbi:UDP-N-acetylmuramoyl-tripeptide--D-alanyl-D-alanine ligase [Anaerosphaera multitolerans]|uniref:UDP-N-acetylmuramoyl-tripeptide--D-alanyl-D-alanine ligase n=1 Tax=Anaerosphaera multitolerans TaxID=2487351 RepID=A0A437S881_9FIRM|nr:UDP-N-acetylmuramoyl-tripeptide--D-alanyl-D-alanine ligase [Anaerosphaera multitolerans]RVU55114.1 UDP-N-acetylmuramoyl-tripeptide--D-alanyl-D-alanine ligase [Anaerosphaera multitolerans]
MVKLLIAEFIIIFITFYFGIIRSNYPLHMLQLEGYENEGYKNWLRENKDKVNKFWYRVNAEGSIIGFKSHYVKVNTEEKTPLVWTDRAKRLFKIHYLVNIGFLVVVLLIVNTIFGITDNFPLALAVLILGSFLVYFFEYRIMLISNSISVPREKKINMGFYKQAQKKIAEYKRNYGLKVLGITGSFGKTSTKVIADTILSEGLKVKNTPSSYNTPMGLSKVINNELTEDREVFIAELGAYKKGEIDEVAQLVQPDIGIITGIGPTHMHLFKTIENIMATKYELIEDLPEDGIAIFNYDNDYVKVLADKTEKRTLRYGTENVEKLDVYAKDIKVDERGSNFTLVIKGEGEIFCESKLLGLHNISNLLAAATAAYVLGLSLEEISRGIKKVEPVEHRLNIVDGGTGVIVIDDAFNSNPVGFRAALDVLREFKSGRKIIITPGMVELGDMEEEENYKIGFEIGKVCDYVILVGKKRTEPIYRGLTDSKYNMENVFVVNSLNEATKVSAHLTKVGDIVLIENDLPDNYNED